MKAQASDADRESIADSVIFNDKGEDSLFAQVEVIWHKLEDANRSKK
jgi:dephospho-CoA kinase